MTVEYTLPEQLEGAGLSIVKAEMLTFRGADLDILGSAVSRLNGLGFQLILAAFKTWKTDGFRLRVVDPSPCLLDAFVRLGAVDRLGGESL